MKIIAIIPARYNSTRFPGKALVKIKGLPMIEHVYQRVAQVKSLNQVIVATDDQRIYQVVKDFGGKVVMTSVKHQSGTDRIAEVAAKIDCDLVVNVQGDEPVLAGEMIETALLPFQKEKDIVMSTLKTEITNKAEINDPNVVKVVCDKNNYALYFSRYPIPYERNKKGKYYKHIGLYVYQRDFLLKYTKLKPSYLEKVESLEQLRVLENAYQIKVMETIHNSIGVDVEEDIVQVEEMLERAD